MTRALVLALALAVLAATPAHAGVLSAEDATDLAQSLADAQEEQDVCYGWQIDNNFDGAPDIGSSTGGPNEPLSQDRSACGKGYVVLSGTIDYACESCESEDSASVSIDSNLGDPPTVRDLRALGLDAGDLTGDADDTTLVNMVNALPLIVADRGNAPYVEYEPATTVPATNHATNKPGSDLLRGSWFWLVLCGGLILAAPAFYLYKRGQDLPPAGSSQSFAAPPPSPDSSSAAPERPSSPPPAT